MFDSKSANKRTRAAIINEVEPNSYDTISLVLYSKTDFRNRLWAWARLQPDLRLKGESDL